MMSGILNRRGFSGTAGTRRANGLPALVISTGSPSLIHAATRGNRFRKSLTVAVFIVRLMCLTASRLPICKRLAGSGDLHRLAFFNPRGHEGESVPQISDGGCFHRETNVSHSIKASDLQTACRLW